MAPANIEFISVIPATSQLPIAPLNAGASWNADARLVVPVRSSASVALTTMFVVPLKYSP